MLAPSIHGIKYIGSASSKLESLAWFFIVIFQFGMAALLIYQVTDTWAKNPEVTVTDLVPAEEIDFPSVTLCPAG